jgi:hypothetical protein
MNAELEIARAYKELEDSKQEFSEFWEVFNMKADDLISLCSGIDEDIEEIQLRANRQLNEVVGK